MAVGKICPFCLLPYDEMYDLIVGALVIDKVFVHYIPGDDTEDDDYIRICPMPERHDILEVIVDEQARTVEVVFDRPE